MQQHYIIIAEEVQMGETTFQSRGDVSRCINISFHAKKIRSLAETINFDFVYMQAVFKLMIDPTVDISVDGINVTLLINQSFRVIST